MIPLLAASFVMQTKPAGPLPSPAPITVPNEVRDWSGFKYLPEGPRHLLNVIPVAADWSTIKDEVVANAVEWHTKVVILERIDRPHERGPEFIWPGHHAIQVPTVAKIKRSLPQLHALVANATGGAVNMIFDVAEEPEPLTVEGNLAEVVRHYLQPRINGGRYQAEDGLFRGPYQSVFVIQPAGGERVEPFQVHGTPVSVLGLSDLEGAEADGVLAAWMQVRLADLVGARASDTGMSFVNKTDVPFDWKAVALGRDVPTETRLKISGRLPAPLNPDIIREGPEPWAKGPRGTDTNIHLAKDPQHGNVLVVEEGGAFRSGGLVLPVVEGSTINAKSMRTLSFWMKSDAKDPIVIRFLGVSQGDRKGNDDVVRLGVDVPFAYDGTWHQVKVDTHIVHDGIVIGPDAASRAKIKNTLGPIVASFADFELTNEALDPKPTPEIPSPTSSDPELRARWAATSGPGEERRKLLRDPIDAVKANAAAAALARPDPLDEPMLVEDALFTFEPTVFTPALQALDKAKTPTAAAAIKQALRIAAAERARGLAAEILAEPGDPHVAPTFVGLNQVRSREARIEAIHALAKLPGSEAAVLRMAYLSQDDPEIKLAATLTADANDDYQGRKLLWSAVNEPSDAVRLESLRRLAASTIPTFRDEGLKGVRDDSVGVRVGLLAAWTTAPSAETVPAIRAALADREPRVRAAALMALGTSPATITSKDLLLDDPDPRVQVASMKLAAAKGVAVPDEIRAKLRKSPDPSVRASAG